ncbi:MAG TPA: CvpA family protein [Firmicutes bacterium]|nr:CvpA family protein [Bacillota bacterium]
MMNWLDYLLIFIFILNLYNGYREGFIRQTVGLASFFVALYFSTSWSAALGGYLQDRFNLDQIIATLSKDEFMAAWLGEMLLNILAFLLVFLIVIFILKTITRRLKIFNRIPVVGPLNVFLGTILGIIKGFLVIFLAVSLISLVKISFLGSAVETSVIAALSQHYMAFLYDFIFHYLVDNLGQLV